MSKERVLVLFSYVVLAFIAYRNCFDIFIPGENYAFMYKYENYGASAILMNMQEGGPRFVAFPLLYLLYQLFGSHAACWIITSISLHILNSFLTYVLTKHLLKTVFAEKAGIISFFCGLLFLISPYQTEGVLWTPINIMLLLHACVTLSGIYLFIRWMENSSPKTPYAIHFLFLLGLFLYEYSLIFPLIYTVIFTLHRKLGRSFLQPQLFFTRILLPQIVFIAVFFIACKLVNGHWFWHAGAVNDIIQTSDYSKTLLKYFAKFFLFYRYLPLETTDDFLRTFSQNRWAMALIVLLTLLAACAILWRTIKTDKRSGYILVGVFVCFLVSLVPVLPLDSSFLTYIYPDRYGYLPSMFYYVFLVCAAFLLLKKFALPLLSGYAVLCWVLLAQTIPSWNASNEQCNSLAEKFKPFMKYDRVYVLNVPTYFNGVAAFRSAFAETMFMKNNSPIENIRVVSGCYQGSAADTVTSVLINGNSVIVSGPQKETPYFSTDGGWARSYETEEFKVVFEPEGCSYTLLFKQEIPPNSAFIYTSVGGWKKAG